MEIADEAKHRPERIILIQIDQVEGTRVVIICHARRSGEDRPPYSERDRSAPDEDRGPEPSPEGPGWGQRSWSDTERSLLERLPPTPGRPAGGEGIALALSSTSEDKEEVDARAERAERAGEGDRPLPSFVPERGLSLPDERPWRPSERGELPSVLMSTWRTGRRGSTSGKHHTRSRHTRRRTSKEGCGRHRSSRAMQHPGTGDDSSWKQRPHIRIPLCKGPWQAEKQPGKVQAKREWAREWSCPLPQGQALPRKRTVRGKGRTVPWAATVIRLAAGPVWPQTVTPGLTMARRTRVHSSRPRTATPRARRTQRAGSGPKTATGTAETARGQKGSVTNPGESAFVHETANGPWIESVTCETGHTTPMTANRHNNALHENLNLVREKTVKRVSGCGPR